MVWVERKIRKEGMKKNPLTVKTKLLVLMSNICKYHKWKSQIKNSLIKFPF